MIVKISLRDQVKKYLQEQMLNGSISFGQRISLPAVAKELGVSVTPIREALTQLQQVNVVEAIPNRGFFLPNLNMKEVEEIYPIIANLEYLGVSQSRYTEKDIEKLQAIQKRIENSTLAADVVTLDFKLHEVLLRNFNNQILHHLLADLKIRVFLYEYHYMKNQELAKLSSSYHNRIIKLLSINKTVEAADLVKESWLTSIDFMRDQF